MKKIAVFSLIFMMVINMAAYAAEYDFLDNQYTSVEQTMTVTFELNKPLDVLDFVFAHESEGFWVNNFFDARNFFEGLTKLQLVSSAKTEISPDYKRMRLSCESSSNIPMQFNPNLKVTADMKTGMWADIDFSDESTPKYEYITRNPFVNKYIKIDMLNILKTGAEGEKERFVSTFGDIMNRDFITKCSADVKRSMLANSAVKKSGKSYTFTFDGAGLKQFIYDISDSIVPVVKKTMTDVEAAEFDKYADTLKGNIEEYGVFDGASFSVKYILNSSGDIASAEMNFTYDRNVYNDLINLGYEESGLDYDKCDVDFSLNIKCDYKNLNKKVNIEFPELNDENSIDMSNPEEFGGYMKDYTDMYSYFVSADSYDELESGEPALPVSDILNGFYIENRLIDVKNGEISVGANEWFDSAIMKSGSDKIIVNGTEFLLNTPLFEKDGVIYADASLANVLFGAELTYAEYDFDSNKVKCDFDMPVNTEYEPDYTDYYVYSDTYEKSANGVIMIPLRSIASAFYTDGGKIDYNDGMLSISSAYGYGNASFKAGDNKLYIDGVEYELDNAPTEKNDRIYVDNSFVKYMYNADYQFGYYDILGHMATWIFTSSEK